MRRARWLLVTALLVEAVVLGGGAVLGRPLPLAAQTPPAGTIEGELRPPEAWLVDLDGVPIEVIGLTEDGDIATYEGLTQQAHFAVAVPADPGTTYLVRATIGGVAYFALSVVLLSSDLPTAEVEIAVYPTTTEAPPLRIAATTVTMLALDRAAGEITFVREDVVVNPSTSTYVAAEDGSTARLPLLEASLAADGAASYLGIPVHGAFTLDGATLRSDVALRPGETLLVTQHVVSYDLDADSYRLRVTPPFETDRIAVRIPERFVASVQPAAEVRRTDPAVIEGETTIVLESGALPPGRSAVVDLEGLSGARAANPLTEPRGAALGLALVLGVIAAGAHVLSRARPQSEDAEP